MKAKRTGLPKIPAADVSEIITSIWRRMGATSVGEQELLAIQDALPEETSPASIARELAAAGAALRHPEVIECDARWREGQIASQIRPIHSNTGQSTACRSAISLVTSRRAR